MKFAALSGVTEIIMGQSPPSSAYNTRGEGLPFFQGKADFGDLYPTARVFCTEPKRIAEAGDILISVRAPVGPTNISQTKCCVGRGLAAIRCSPTIELKYLLFFLRFHEPELARQSSGSTFDAISRDDLENVRVPLLPLPDQKRIAAILDKADRLRRLRRYALELGDTYLQSVFLEMFGDPVTNPKGWEIVNLGTLISFVTSGSRGWAEHYSETGAHFVRVQNLRGHTLSFEDMAFVSPPANSPETERARIRPGDLLLAITGATIGLSALAPTNIGEAYVNQHVAIVRLRESVNARFAAAFMAHDRGGQYQIAAMQYGNTKPGMSLEQIKSIKIPMPPLPRQVKFAHIVQKFDRLCAQQREAERQAEHLFQSLLHRAFAGEL